MNDLRSPREDRPYQPSTRQSPRLNQDDTQNYGDDFQGYSSFDRIRQSRWFPLASVFAALLIFSAIVSYAYKQGSQTGVNATTPIVEASNEDYKEKPKNAGGMDVPFQDAVVFDNLQNKDQTASKDTVESLLPPPEEAVSDTPAATTAPVAETAKTENIPSAPAAQQSEDAPAVTTTTTTTTTAPVAPAVPAETPAVANTAVTTETLTSTPATPLKTADAPAKKAPEADVKKLASVAPASAPATAKIETGSYKIQLGSFRDEAAARAAWSKFQQQFHSQLSSVSPQFPRADLGAKGVFYRVQGTNLSKASADDLCRSLNAAKAGSCIVTK
ncbi:MAG: hypothetical protein JWM96_886 [Alphaproteobacteria bacterium]|nr:hypothetical protein [Alphaproteobacteria bacterium]